MAYSDAHAEKQGATEMLAALGTFMGQAPAIAERNEPVMPVRKHFWVFVSAFTVVVSLVVIATLVTRLSQ